MSLAGVSAPEAPPNEMTTAVAKRLQQPGTNPGPRGRELLRRRAVLDRPLRSIPPGQSEGTRSTRRSGGALPPRKASQLGVSLLTVPQENLGRMGMAKRRPPKQLLERCPELGHAGAENMVFHLQLSLYEYTTMIIYEYFEFVILRPH